MGFGGFILGGAVAYHLFGDPDPVDRFTRGFELAIIAFMALSVAYGGYWISRGRWPASGRYEIVAWCFTTAFALASVAVGVILLQLRVGAGMVDPAFVVLLAASTGAAGGTLIGIKHVEASIRADRVELHRESLVLLNQLIRHHVLNAVQTILVYAHHVADRIGGADGDELDVIDRQAQRVVTVASNVRVICDAVNGDLSSRRMSVESLLADLQESLVEKYGTCRFEVGLDEGVEVRANEALLVGLELVLGDLVEARTDAFSVDVSASDRRGHVTVRFTPRATEGGDATFRSTGPSGHLSPHDPELSILGSLLRSLGGDLTVETEPEPGFVVSLPRAR